MYQLTHTNAVIRIEDGAAIPLDPKNKDYQDYEEWLDAGNTPEAAQAESAPPPITVSAWQFRKALNAQGLRQQVEDAVSASQDQNVKDGWQYATEFVENDPMVVAMGTQLGKSESDMHSLFSLAESL